jgi:AmiR/NasT family two-component response regulator
LLVRVALELDVAAATMAKSTSMGQPSAPSPALRILRSAKRCRARDLRQLAALGDLVRALGGLVHALQKERGVSSIYVGSRGARFAAQLATRVAESEDLESDLRARLERVDEELSELNNGARLYARVAMSLWALDSLAEVRRGVSGTTLAARDTIKAFTGVIAALLAVGYEAADVAADPAISRSLVALVNFTQGKEYAGQERAIGGAAFSGTPSEEDRSRLAQLMAAQDRAFRIFSEFADSRCVERYRRLCDDPNTRELDRLRSRGRAAADGPHAQPTADAWYEATTRRIDGLRLIEEDLTAEAGRLCAAKIEEAETDVEAVGASERSDWNRSGAPLAMVVADFDALADPTAIERGIGLYALGADVPQTMRPILDVLGEQSRRIADISTQLESARSALSERKVIERAKGLLMRSRQLSENDAYALLRQTAMNQNKRLIEIATAIVSMAGLFPS